MTEAFDVVYPEIAITDISWKPTETTLTEGTAINFTIKVANTSGIDITGSFKVNVAMDGRIFKTVSVDGLKSGEVKEVYAKWSASAGSHVLKVIADSKKAVIDPDATVQKSVTLPPLTILYPNLDISNVIYSPIRISAGKPVTFIASISNQSVATAFKRFNIALYVDGKAVSGAVIDGIRGYSTVPVALTWTPSVGGAHTIRIVADSYGELSMDAPGEGIMREWSATVNVGEALVMSVSPSDKEADDDLLAVLYTSGQTIAMRTTLTHTSNAAVKLSPDDDAEVSYELKRSGTGEVIDSGLMGYNFGTGEFYNDLYVLPELTTGVYRLEFTGSAGTEILSQGCNIQIVKSGQVTVSVDHEDGEYQLGETIVVSGSFFEGGEPLANTKVILDFQLAPRLREPRVTIDENGNEILMQWSAEQIVFVTTDSNGNFEYDFTPFTGEAGDWAIYAFGYNSALGLSASTAAKVWGMASSPSVLTVTASENSQFSKEIIIRHASPKNDSGDPLTGIYALRPVEKSGSTGISATLDTSAMASSLAPGASTSVVLNVSAALGCSNTAEYEIVFGSAQGATTVTRVKINIVPATPIPVTDQKNITAGMNPGDSLTRVLTVTNKGKGTMTGVKITAPAGIPWVSAGAPLKTTLAPNESTTFTVTMAPGEGVALGRYQDTLKVSDTSGKFYANVALDVEITSAKTGGISFRVTDDVGSKVAGAEIVIISKESYTSYTGGVESEYYPSYTARTDANGIAQLYDKPLGEYDLVIQSSGRKKLVSVCTVMPSTGAPYMDITLENLPVQIEWTVVPTTIIDEYEVKLELTFGAHIPTPSFGFNPPWVNIPKNVTESIIVEANIVNTGLIAISDVVASVVRSDKTETGISIVGGGYIGEIAAHGSARIKLQVQPGVYNLLFGTNSAGNPNNYIKVEGTYVSFDSDTGLPIDPSPIVTGVLPLYNPSETTVKLEVRMPDNNNTVITETVKMPEGQMEELRYVAPDGADKEDLLKEDADSAYEIVKMTLSQKATLERQAFDADAQDNQRLSRICALQSPGGRHRQG